MRRPSRALTIATAGVLVAGLGVGLGVGPSVASDRDGAASARDGLPAPGQARQRLPRPQPDLGRQARRRRRPAGQPARSRRRGHQRRRRTRSRPASRCASGTRSTAASRSARSGSTCITRQPRRPQHQLRAPLDAQLRHQPPARSASSAGWSSALDRGQRRLLRHRPHRGAARRDDRPRAAGCSPGSRDGLDPGMNSSLSFDASGPHVSPLSVQYTHPPAAAPGSSTASTTRACRSGRIGVFTHDVEPHQGLPRHRRQEARPRGRARARTASSPTSRTLSSGRKIRSKDRVLIGVGAGRRPAQAAQDAPEGHARPSASRAARPTAAISGDRPLLVNGVRTVINNTDRPPAYGGRHRRRRPQAATSSSSTAARPSAAATRWSSSPTS